MDRVDAEVGTVIRPTPGGALVQIGSRKVRARNALNVRTPPNAGVLVARSKTTLLYSIIGRDRSGDAPQPEPEREEIDATPGTVQRPTPGGAWVRVGNRTLLARNRLNLRVPPDSDVLVARDKTTLLWHIVGRNR